MLRIIRSTKVAAAARVLPYGIAALGASATDQLWPSGATTTHPGGHQGGRDTGLARMTQPDGVSLLPAVTARGLVPSALDGMFVQSSMSLFIVASSLWSRAFSTVSRRTFASIAR
jgi:hypothetical protein